MKIYAIIFFLLISSTIGAQKNKYKHDYKFTVEGLKMESRMEFKQEPAEMSVPSLRGAIKDNDSSYPVPHATIKITSLDSVPLRSPKDLSYSSSPSQSIYDVYIKADAEGKFVFTGKPGRYKIQVASVSFVAATSEFELHIHELLKADILLSSFTMPTIYHIHSKKKLNATEIESIKKCVKDSWKNKNGKTACEKKDEYYITFEI